MTARAAAVVLACTLLVACGDRVVTLFGGMNESEANRLVAYLDSQGLKSHKVVEREGTAVAVGATQLAQASRLAAQAGLPRAQYKGFGAVFPKDGLISSPLEERARLTFAVSQELEAMLADIPGVLGTRVNVVIPERRNGRNTDLPAAAVLIRHRSDMETDLLEMKVRRLVASSVPGLVDGDSRQISVTFMPVSIQGKVSPGAPETRKAASPSSSMSSGSGAVSPDQTSPAAEAAPDRKRLEGTFTKLSIGLGVLCAVLVVAWVLRGQLSAMFKPRKGATASPASSGLPS